MSLEQDLQEVEKAIPGKVQDLTRDHSKVTTVTYDTATQYIRLDLQSVNPGPDHPLGRVSFYEAYLDPGMRDRLAERQVYHYPQLRWLSPAYNAIFYDNIHFILKILWSEVVKGPAGIIRRDDIGFQMRFAEHIAQAHYYSLPAAAQEPRVTAGNLAYVRYSNPSYVDPRINDPDYGFKSIQLEPGLIAASNAGVTMLANETVYCMQTSNPRIPTPGKSYFSRKVNARDIDGKMSREGREWLSLRDSWPVAVDLSGNDTPN